MPCTTTIRARRHSAWFKCLTLLLLASLLGVGCVPRASARAAREVATLPATSPVAAPAVFEPTEPPGVDVPAELVGRTAFSRTARNADGSLTTTFATRPLHWQDRQTREWRDFDNTLRPAEAADVQRGVAFKNSANGYHARFSTPQRVAAGGPLLDIALDDVAVGVTPVGARPTAASVDGAHISFTDAFPGVDARYTVDNERVKADLILKQAPTAPLRFVFDLQLQGVSAAQHPDGQINLVDATGEPRFVLPPWFMVDSNTAVSEQPYSLAIVVGLQERGGGTVRVTVEPDLTWLQDPARVYPVLLDPTIEPITYKPTGGSSADVTIEQADIDRNFNSLTTLYVGKNASSQRQDVLIKFPELDKLPQDSAVIRASMRLYVPSGTAGLPVDVYRATSAWNSTTVTWQTAPSTESTRRASFNTTVPGWNSVGISDLARRWVRGEYPNHGVRLVTTAGANTQIAIRAGSYGDASLRPEMQITYVQATRFGLNRLWTYTNQEYGGGNSSAVNLSTGNLVFTHRGGTIPARGFDVDLTHTYNSQDSFGRHAPITDSDPNTTRMPGGFFGSGWSLSQDVRLSELDSGNAVVFKDGMGGDHRVYVKEADATGKRTYLRPLHYDFALTKDINNPPADAGKVYTLVADTGGMKQFFDAEGKRTRQQDRNGNYLAYSYDTSDRLIRITDVAGRTTTLEYNGANGQLSKITDMAGRVSTYSYGANDTYNLVAITHAVGTADEMTTRLDYLTSGQLIRVINPRGYASEIEYAREHDWDTAGSVEGWSVEAGTATIAQSTEQAFDGSGSLKVNLSNISSSTTASIAHPYTAPTSFASIPVGLLFRVYVPAGAPALRVTAVLGRQTSSDSYGATLTAGVWNNYRVEGVQVDPAWPLTKLTLRFATASGEPAYTGAVYVDRLFFKGITTEVEDAKAAENLLARYSYDWDGKTTTVARLDTVGTLKDTRYKYDRIGQVETVTDPLGNPTKQTRDELLRLTDVTLPGGTASTYSYSYYPNSNQLQTWKNEAGETWRRGADTTDGDTRYALDPLNEQRRASNQAYDATIFNQDAAGNVTSVVTNRYAAGTNLEQPTFPAEQVKLRESIFGYGAGGMITSMTDPKGNDTIFGYQTTTGYLTSIDAPAGNGETTRRVTTITRNSDGSVQKVVDPKGQTTTYDYDGLGRLRRINYGVVNGTPAFSVSYTLDDNDNLTGASDKTGSSTWVYDENNRPVQESRTQNGVTKTASYGYFANGLQSRLTTFDNQTVNFGYDAALRLTSQTDPGDGGRTISYGYDERSRRTSITFPSGVQQQLGYDTGGRVKLLTLKKSDGTTLQSFDYYYGFDANGNRMSDYDNGHVIRATEQDGSQVSYDYDDLERLKAATRTGVNPFNQSYVYDLNNNRTSITSNGSTQAATYDAANQMTSRGSLSYSYDRNGNMTGYGSDTLTYDAANKWTSATINGQSMAFGYDALGRRTSGTVGGNRTDYWYDLTGLTQETGWNNVRYLRDPGGTLLSRNGGAGHYNYGRDRLGSTTALVTTGQTLANTYRYDPWGQSIGTSGTTYNPFQFTGVYLDSATGLYAMTQRYYGPASGRFTQLDPLPRSILDVNRYAYAGCNPANFVDPTGLETCASEGANLLTVLGGLYFTAITYDALSAAAIATAFAAGGVASVPALATLSLIAVTVGTGWIAMDFAMCVLG